jgi:hypothetical protein
MRRLTAILVALGLVMLVPSATLAAPPANDLPDGAIVIPPTLPTTIDQDTTEATVSTDDVGCGAGGIDQATVWYTITPTTDVSVLFDARATDYQVGINLFEGAATPEALVDCVEMTLVADLSAGTTYYVMFADLDGDPNGGALSVTVDAAPPPIEVDLTIDRVGKVNQREGNAVITGTITCSEELEGAFLDVSVTQRVGKYTIRGFGGGDTACGPTPTEWSAFVFGDNGRLGGGKATVTVVAGGCGELRCGDAEVTASVRLRR